MALRPTLFCVLRSGRHFDALTDTTFRRSEQHVDAIDVSLRTVQEATHGVWCFLEDAMARLVGTRDLACGERWRLAPPPSLVLGWPGQTEAFAFLHFATANVL